MQNQKILIIGFGKMGKAHLSAFVNKKFQIYIYDRNKKKSQDYLTTQGNVTFLRKLPEKKKFFLTIISTKSKERFKVFKNFQKNNKSKFFLLEKFAFLKKQNFNYVLKKTEYQNIFIIKRIEFFLLFR